MLNRVGRSGISELIFHWLEIIVNKYIHAQKQVHTSHSLYSIMKTFIIFVVPMSQETAEVCDKGTGILSKCGLFKLRK